MMAITPWYSYTVGYVYFALYPDLDHQTVRVRFRQFTDPDPVFADADPARAVDTRDTRWRKRKSLPKMLPEIIYLKVKTNDHRMII